MADIGLASVIVSVDVAMPDAWDSTATQIERTAGELLHRLNAAGVVATWGLSDVAHPLGDEIVEQSSHELAMLIGGRVPDTAASYSDFAPELQRRMNAARMVGREPTTVHVAAGSNLGQLDVVSKLGINAVRIAPSIALHESIWQRWFGIGRAVTNELPHMVRWGVWQFAAHIQVGPTSTGTMQYSIDRAVNGGLPIVAAINVAEIAQRSRSGQSAIDAMLRHVARRQNEGSLTVQTIDQTVARLSLKHIGRPSQSILRSRAA